MITPRPYQVEADQAARQRLLTDDATLVVMATGTGKTTVLAEVLRHYNRGLVLAHRKELVEQNAARIEEQLGTKTGIEMASRRSKGEDVIVGSVQSVAARPEAVTRPDIVIIDEAHHAVAPTYRGILDRWPGVKVLGVTATPDRTDQLALGQVFESVAFRYETPDAIADKWLVPVIWGQADGVEGLIFESFGRRTVVFTSTVAEAKWVAEQIGSYAGFVHGGMPKKQRASVLEKFKKGELTHMVNCNILTEGFDCPEIECVAMLRSTQSRAVFMQCLGRGLRLAPGKSDCLYLDLTMEMPDHSLVAPSDALGGLYDDCYHVSARKFEPISFWKRWIQ